MDKSLLYKAIGGTHVSQHLTVSQLEEIRTSFPYFSIAQVLLAKAYRENNDYRFADQLHDAALYTSDRKVLFEKMNTSFTEQVIEKTTSQSDVHIEPVDQESLLVEPIQESIEEHLSITEDLAPAAESIVTQDFVEIDSVEAQNVVTITEKEPEVISLAAELEDVPEEEPKTYAEWMVWKAKRQRLEIHQPTSTPSEAIESPAEDAIEKQTDLDNEPKEIARTQTDLGILETFILAEAVDSSIELEVGEGEREQEEEEEEGRPVFNPKVIEQQNLIDQFIKLQPKITPGRASDYPQNGNLGKESLEEDFTFATETMAKLFVKQGKLDKARKVYKQLIALYPEKSIYFAAQLKILNQNKK